MIDTPNLAVINTNIIESMQTNKSANYIVIAVPATISAIAQKIGRSLDPDLGGDMSFSETVYDDNEIEYAMCESLAKESFAPQALYFKEHPEILMQAVNTDIAQRWPEETPLTLEEAEAFCTQSLLATSDTRDLESLMSQLNIHFKVIEPETPVTPIEELP